MESYGFLRFTDENLKSTFLRSLSTMQKNRLFCDVILVVENTEIHAHRNVLACVSPHLMELFSAEQETNNDGTIATYRLNGYITKEGLNILVEYAYTAQLDIPDEMIKDVYLAGWQLRMECIVNECARHLVSNLSIETCIETRALPGINRNKAFVQDVDNYISQHFAELSQTPTFLQLPLIQIEILHQTKQEMAMVVEDSLSRLVLEWIKRQIYEDEGSVESLSQRSHMLYLALDNSLQDCQDLPAGHNANSDIVKDYKRLASKCPANTKKHSRKCLAQPERPRVLKYTREVSDRRYDEELKGDADFNLIGTLKVSEHTLISLVTLNGALYRLSIQSRLNRPSPKINAPSTASSSMTTPSPVQTPDITTIAQDVVKKLDIIDLETSENPDLFLEVAAMSESKCGLGVAELDGKLLVVGGYDRAECLKSVESYCPETNSWTQEMSLSEARGRVQIAVIDGTVYAVGGCNGTTELDTVECLHSGAQKWKKCCKLPFSRSNAGVCALNNQIFCIGGWNGQSGIKQCDVYSPADNKWTSIAPLNTGRYQTGVTAFKGKLWAVGGSDAWNCLASTEIYDPETNQWAYGASLSTARRGCGVAEFNGKLYAVGGSDGSHSLKTTEYYDEATKTWVLGPNLTTARSIVSVVVVQDRLYAIGGFSGKTFLNTIEYLDSQTNEWTKFVPQMEVKKNEFDLKDLVSTLKLESKLKTEDDEVFLKDTLKTNGHHEQQNEKTDKSENSTNSIVNLTNDNLSAVKTNKNFFSNNSSDILKQEQQVVSSKNTINEDDEVIPLIN
jgi:influenza virus NS1A-binding protein